MRTDFVLDAPAQAFYARQPEQSDGLVHHCDNGSQYISICYTERLAQATGIDPSVGSQGDSYDNVLAESVDGLYKAELIHRRAPRMGILV